MSKVQFFTFLILSLTSAVVFAQPANDVCGSAISLTVNDACIMDSNNNATATEGLGCWGGSPSNYSHSVWYSFVANNSSQVIDITGNSLGTNFLTSVYSGSCGSWVEEACDNSGASITVTGLSPGSTYYIMMDGSGNNVGSYCIRVLDPPPNDDCSDAVTLTVGGGCVDGFNSGATDEGLSNPSCWNGPTHYDESVWYTFQATDDSITVNFGDGTLGTSAMGAVYSGACGSLTEVGCAKNGGEIDLLGLTVNDWYYIMVDGNTTDDGTFCISVYQTPPPPPPIGTCVNPRDLQIATTCTNIKGTQYDGHNNILSTDLTTGEDGGADATGYSNPEGYESACSGTSATDDAYWVRFEATASTVTVDNGGTDALDYTLYSGSDCSALTEMDCQTINGGGSTTFSGLTTGVTYMMMITNSSSSTTTQRYACLTGTAYTNPLDDCADAMDITENTIYNLTNAEASQDRSLCSGSMENNIWIKWTCPSDWTGDAFVHLFNQDCACDNGLQMSIYTASTNCPPNNGPTCEIELNPNNNRDFYGQFTPTPGSTYYITIDGFADCACDFDFAITNTTTVPTALALSKFISIKVTPDHNKNSIEWSTVLDEDFKNFVIERSSNAKEFNDIGQLHSTNGIPNGRSIRYNYHDEINEAGGYYYRIREEGKDGSVLYSKVQYVKNQYLNDIYLFPRMLENGESVLTVLFANEEKTIDINIISSTGNRVLSHSFENRKKLTLDSRELKPGLYMVVIKTLSGRYVEKIYKNK